MNRELSRVAIWDITSECNLKCSHCYNQERYWEKSSSYKKLSKNDLKIIIDKLVKLSFTRLHLLGGEPLLATNLNFIIQYAKSKGLDVTLVTNGTLLTEKVIEELCKLEVSLLSISIDGTNREDNDSVRGDGIFDTVVKNVKRGIEIRNQLDSNMLMVMSFTLTSRNIFNSANIVDFALQLGFDEINISYLSNEGNARNSYANFNISENEKFDFIDKVMKNFEEITDRHIGLHIDSRSYLSEYIYKKFGIEMEGDSFGCRGGDEQFYVLADSTLLPCSPAGTSIGDFTKKILPNKGTYPNLLTDTIDNIKNSPDLISFYNFTHNCSTYNNIYPCNDCKYTCRACPLLYNYNKTVDECIVAKHRINELDNTNIKTIFNKLETLRLSSWQNRVDILTFDNQNHYILEDISARIWDGIDGLKTFENIINSIYEDYKEQVEYKVFISDALDLLYELKSLKLIY